MASPIKILVCTPAFGGLMNFEYVTSLLLLERTARASGVEVFFYFIANESLIQRARNFLCHHFMTRTDCTHLLFIDADIQFDAADVIRMVIANVDVIGGVYPKKLLHWERLGSMTPEQLDALRRSDNTPLLDFVNLSPTLEPAAAASGTGGEADYSPQVVRWVGTGFVLIKRGVLERMQADKPERTFWAEQQKVYAFFDCVLWNEVYLSEDYYFCERWRELGGTVHSAPWAKCTHWGTYGFRCAPTPT